MHMGQLHTNTQPIDKSVYLWTCTSNFSEVSKGWLRYVWCEIILGILFSAMNLSCSHLCARTEQAKRKHRRYAPISIAWLFLPHPPGGNFHFRCKFLQLRLLFSWFVLDTKSPCLRQNYIVGRDEAYTHVYINTYIRVQRKNTRARIYICTFTNIKYIYFLISLILNICYFWLRIWGFLMILTPEMYVMCICDRLKNIISFDPNIR